MGKTNEQKFAESGREDYTIQISYVIDMSYIDDNRRQSRENDEILKERLVGIYFERNNKFAKGRAIRGDIQMEAEREIRRGEEDEKMYKFLQEYAGVVITGLGVAFAVPVASAASVGVVLVVSWIGLVLGILQLMYGLFRTLCVVADDEKAYEIVTTDESIVKFFQIVDALSTLLAVYGLVKALIPQLATVGTKLSQLKDILKSMKQSQEKIQRLEKEIADLIQELEKETNQFMNFKKNASNARPVANLSQFKADLNAVKNRLKQIPIKEIRLEELRKITTINISKLEDELLNEITKFDKIRLLGIFFDNINNAYLTPLITSIKGASWDEILALFSLYANSEEGYGISTGTIYDLIHKSGLFKKEK